MLIKNAKILLGHSFQEGDICFDGTIRAIGSLEGEADLDAQGAYLVPGFVDIHTHGAVGEDFSDGNAGGLPAMSVYYASQGVTSYLATTMSLQEETLSAAMEALGAFRPERGAKCAGIHLEGPFLGYAKRGAQAAENLHAPDPAMFHRLNAASGGRVRMVTVACEEPGAMEFIRQVSPVATVSLGHTSCTYDQAMEAFACGASHATHLFNGMDGLHHRNPGIVAAAMDAGASVELICDGLHIHPAVVRLAHRLYGERLNLISDSQRCAGMPDGDYLLGGQLTTKRGSRVTMAGTDTLAGSSISVLDAVRNVVAFGLPLGDAVYAASTAPALAAGLEDVGSIACGKRADLLLLSRELELKAVFVDGVKQSVR